MRRAVKIYANQLLQQSSRPHIVTLWNYARGKLVKSTGPTSSTVSRYASDQFSTVSRYLSRTIEWLKAANDLNSKHATSSKSGIRIMWYIGFAEDTNSYSPPIADTINDRRRLWAHFSSVSGLNLSGCERHVDLLRRHIQRNILGRFQEKNDLLNLNLIKDHYPCCYSNMSQNGSNSWWKQHRFYSLFMSVHTLVFALVWPRDIPKQAKPARLQQGQGGCGGR